MSRENKLSRSLNGHLAFALATTMLLPAAAQASGPSLKVTLQFIVDKIQGQEPIKGTGSFHNNSTGQDASYPLVYTPPHIETDAANCRVKLTNHHGQIAIQLSGVSDVSEQPAPTDGTDGNTSWHSDITEFQVDIKWKGAEDDKTRDFSLQFADEDMAVRIGKAFAHAAELCGGLRKEPF